MNNRLNANQISTWMLFIVGIVIFIIWRLIKRSSSSKNGYTTLPFDLERSAERVREALLSIRPTGFIFGRDANFTEWITKKEDQDGHILVIGGSGTGKSSCIAIPSLLCWQNRVFAIDIKGELLEKTDRPGVTTSVFNPENPDAYGYNPFYILPRSKNFKTDMRQIAFALISMPTAVKDPFWISSARDLLNAALLHFYDQKLSFVECLYKIKSTPIKELVKEIAEAGVDGTEILISDFIGLSSNTLTGINKEMGRHLVDFLNDEDIVRAFSKPNKECIKPVDLERGSDIFLQIPEDKIEQWGKMTGLIVSQFINYFRRRKENSRNILFLLDEFPSLGKIDDIVGALSTLRSRGITFCLIVQSLSQLDEIYGRNNRKTILNNCQYKAILDISDSQEADEFSKMVGTHLIQMETRSKSSNTSPVGRLEDNKSFWGTSYREYSQTTSHSESTNYNYREERKIKPEEYSQLVKKGELILYAPGEVLRVKKTSIYDKKIKVFRLNYKNPTQEEQEKLEEELSEALIREEQEANGYVSMPKIYFDRPIEDQSQYQETVPIEAGQAGRYWFEILNYIKRSGYQEADFKRQRNGTLYSSIDFEEQKEEEKRRILARQQMEEEPNEKYISLPKIYFDRPIDDPSQYEDVIELEEGQVQRYLFEMNHHIKRGGYQETDFSISENGQLLRNEIREL